MKWKLETEKWRCNFQKKDRWQCATCALLKLDERLRGCVILSWEAGESEGTRTWNTDPLSCLPRPRTQRSRLSCWDLLAERKKSIMVYVSGRKERWGKSGLKEWPRFALDINSADHTQEWVLFWNLKLYSSHPFSSQIYLCKRQEGSVADWGRRDWVLTSRIHLDCTCPATKLEGQLPSGCSG